MRYINYGLTKQWYRWKQRAERATNKSPPSHSIPLQDYTPQNAFHPPSRSRNSSINMRTLHTLARVGSQGKGLSLNGSVIVRFWPTYSWKIVFFNHLRKVSFLSRIVIAGGVPIWSIYRPSFPWLPLFFQLLFSPSTTSSQSSLYTSKTSSIKLLP